MEALHSVTVLAWFPKDKALKRSFEIQMKYWRRKGLCTLTLSPGGY